MFDTSNFCCTNLVHSQHLTKTLHWEIKRIFQGTGAGEPSGLKTDGLAAPRLIRAAPPANRPLSLFSCDAILRSYALHLVIVGPVGGVLDFKYTCACCCTVPCRCLCRTSTCYCAAPCFMIADWLPPFWSVKYALLPSPTPPSPDRGPSVLGASPRLCAVSQ